MGYHFLLQEIFWLRGWTHVPWVSWIGRWILCQLSYQGSPQWQRATCFTKGPSPEVWGDCLEEVGLDYCDGQSKGKQATFVENITKGHKEQRPEIMKGMPVVDGRRGWIAVGIVWTKRQKNWVWCQQSLCLLNASAKQKSKTVKNLTVEISKNKRKFTPGEKIKIALHFFIFILWLCIALMFTCGLGSGVLVGGTQTFWCLRHLKVRLSPGIYHRLCDSGQVHLSLWGSLFCWASYAGVWGMRWG